MLALSIINIYCSYHSINVIDEQYFNNKRAHLTIENFLKTGKLLTANDVNNMEVF